MPSLEHQQWYGSAAIVIDMMSRDPLAKVWVKIVRKGWDKPPKPLTPEERAFYDQIEADEAARIIAENAASSDRDDRQLELPLS